jgi:hypothetical protein
MPEHLEVYFPDGHRFTGRSILVEVTHLTADSWGLPSGLVVMAIRTVGV